MFSRSNVTSFYIYIYMGVSLNGGTPKWMVKIMETSYYNGTIWVENPLFLGTPIHMRLKEALSVCLHGV